MTFASIQTKIPLGLGRIDKKVLSSWSVRNIRRRVDRPSPNANNRVEARHILQPERSSVRFAF
jgi:hypothetical protein